MCVCQHDLKVLSECSIPQEDMPTNGNVRRSENVRIYVSSSKPKNNKKKIKKKKKEEKENS